MDRKALAEIVFGDVKELRRLEGLLYPRLEQQHRELIARHLEDETARAVVLDAPKLYDAGLDALCDSVVFVETDDHLRAQRVQRDRGWATPELARRENLQKPLDIKRAKADDTVANNSSLDDLRTQVEIVFASVLARFSTNRSKR